ncbi:B- and T-lymphocyte attenuator-like isoform X2 [Anguilla anguilla]|uniref:B- and T-lymphocyte attenuator-like isoform X2 n=1 Tax=Anguilla anguilla TaxID=7936 RepID=UPI0015B13276|nr:B- and T-lymphocyte attenuator-like isoform X2 [Anguilla anguilla]
MASVALLLLMLFCLHAQGKGDNCSVAVRVKRNTVRTASIMDTLTINCTVQHCGMKRSVRWCKLGNGFVCTIVTKTEHIDTHWRKSDDEKDIYFLKFINISINDAGLYRCEMSGNTSLVSHSINVTVIAAKDTGNSQTNETRTTPQNGHEQNGPPPLDWLLYIYILAGVVVLVVIVVVTSCMLKSKGSKRPTAAIQTQGQVQRNLQSSAPLKKNEPPQPSLQASPYPSLPERPRSIRSPRAQRPPSVRSSGAPAPTPAPAPVPTKRSSRTKRSPAREAPPPSSSSGAARPAAVGSSGVYDNDREEGENTVVYAALNHQVGRKVPSHTYIPMEELTEYAAIRVS